MSWKTSLNNKEHPDAFPMSVYENTDLLPVINRATIISGLVTVVLNYTAGYALSTYRDSPWVQEILSFVLGISGAFATRFDDLQGLTQTGGYYYVGSLIMSSVAGVILSFVFLGAYLRITFWSEYAVRFNPKSLKGVVYNIFATAFIIYVFFYWKMNTGPYLGMNRIFFPSVFPILAYGVAPLFAITVCHIIIFAMKFLFLRKA